MENWMCCKLIKKLIELPFFSRRMIDSVDVIIIMTKICRKCFQVFTSPPKTQFSMINF